MKDPAHLGSSALYFSPPRKTISESRFSLAAWIPQPAPRPLRPHIPELHIAPFVLNLTLALGPASDIWAFTEFPVWASTAFTCSWLLPVFIPCLDSFSFPDFFWRSCLKVWRPVLAINQGSWAFIALDKSSSSLHYCPWLHCQNSLLLHCQFCCQILA